MGAVAQDLGSVSSGPSYGLLMQIENCLKCPSYTCTDGRISKNVPMYSNSFERILLKKNRIRLGTVTKFFTSCLDA